VRCAREESRGRRGRDNLQHRLAEPNFRSPGRQEQSRHSLSVGRPNHSARICRHERKRAVPGVSAH
jgi:hypothetical protein